MSGPSRFPESRPRVVPAGPAHAELLACLSDRALGNAWSVDLMTNQLAGAGGFGWLALAGDRPCGFILLRAAADEAEILALATRPEDRRAGHARRLLHHAGDAMLRLGVARLYLEVAADNHPARRLYREVGFRDVGRRPAYYRRRDGAVDALVMAFSVKGGG